MLALDLIHEHVARDLLVFQSMQRGSAEIEPLEKDYAFTEVEVFDRPGFPKLHFIERRYAGDPTNWWAPNRACSEALLRSAGFAILAARKRRCSSVAGRSCAADLVRSIQGQRRHDARSSDDLERAQQQIPLGLRDRPGLERLRSDGTAGRDAIAAEDPGLPRVLGGISPIDPLFIQNMQGQASSSTSTPWPCTGFRWTGTIGCSTSGRTS